MKKRQTGFLIEIAFAALIAGCASTANREQVSNAVSATAGSLDCSDVRVAGVEGSTVKLADHVENGRQNDLIRQKVMEVEEVKQVVDDLSVVPRPFCSAIAVLKQYVRPSETAGAIALRPSKGCDVIYRQGEVVTADVSCTKEHLNYIYADYYMADHKTVAHLFPYADQHEINASFVTVRGPSNPDWTVALPCGREMIPVISSPKPLFSPPRPLAESAEAYLWSLGRVLPADSSGSKMSAAYCFITTAER